MRFPLAYYLMLIYLTVMFKPLIPVISDAYSHIFGEAIHLATVHAKYGNHHLEKALAKSNENNTNQKNTGQDENSQVHVNSTGCPYNFYMDNIMFRFYFIRLGSLPETYLSRVIPPPKC